jgi:hypothetical protein
MSRKHPHPQENITAIPVGTEAAERFTAIRHVLRQYLVHKRSIPNGKDFLFQGPQDELHGSLRMLVEIERTHARFLQFDYAQVEEYFLLRVVGSEAHQHAIAVYFD